MTIRNDVIEMKRTTLLLIVTLFLLAGCGSRNDAGAGETEATPAPASNGTENTGGSQRGMGSGMGSGGMMGGRMDPSMRARHQAPIPDGICGYDQSCCG